MWLRGHQAYGNLAGQEFKDYERAVLTRLIRGDSGDIFFRINLPVGAEIDEVVRNVTLRIQEIRNRSHSLHKNQ